MSSYVLSKPVITEKSLAMVKQANAYTFAVSPKAGKREIKAAIEQTFGVTVLDLKTVTLPERRQRTGKRRVESAIPGRKKAIAFLPAGQKIALFDL